MSGHGAEDERLLSAEVERFLAAATEPERVRGVRLLRDRVQPRGLAARRLVAVLADPGRYVPHAARAALQTLSHPLAPGGADALEALLEGLGARDAVVRTGCCWSLAQPQGPRADEVGEAVGRLIDDPDPLVRDAVAGVLGRVGGPAGARAERLSVLARDADARVRVAALRSLGLAPGLAIAGRNALLRALDDGHTAVRLAAAEALGALAQVGEADGGLGGGVGGGLDGALRARVREVLLDEPDGPVIAPLRALLELPGEDGPA